MLFNGKCDVRVDTYNPGKSVKIVIVGPSGKELSLYTSDKAYDRFAGEATQVAKSAPAKTTGKPGKPGKPDKTIKTAKVIDKTATKNEMGAELKKLLAQLKK